MTERLPPNSNEKGSPPLFKPHTRREFLKGAVIAGLGLAASLYGLFSRGRLGMDNTPTPVPTESPEQRARVMQELRGELGKLGVQAPPMWSMVLDSRGDSKYPTETEAKSVFPDYWTPYTLRLLLELVKPENNYLPPHYYKSDARGILRIGLSSLLYGSQAGGYGIERVPKPRDIFMSDGNVIDPNDSLSGGLAGYGADRSSLQSIVHEMTHVAANVNHRLNASGEIETENSPLFVEMLAILGIRDFQLPYALSPTTRANFSQSMTAIFIEEPTALQTAVLADLGYTPDVLNSPPILTKDIIAHAQAHNNNLTEQDVRDKIDEIYFYDRILYGSTTTPNEFLAVMGELYWMLGKARFIIFYSKVFGEDKATKLYDFANASLYTDPVTYQAWEAPWSQPGQRNPFQDQIAVL